MPTGPQRMYMGKPHSVLVGRRGRPINVGDKERMLSAIAGGALTLYGLRRGSLGGLLLAGLGAALGYRGITGHCGLYDMLMGAFSVQRDRVGLSTSMRSTCDSRRGRFWKLRQIPYRRSGGALTTISRSILTPRLPTWRAAPPASSPSLSYRPQWPVIPR